MLRSTTDRRVITSDNSQIITTQHTGKLRYLIASDESGTDSKQYYGFGALWMNYQRRGDFLKYILDLRLEHDYFEEIKWSNVFLKRQEFYEDLIEYFFKNPALAFRCLIIPRDVVDLSLHVDDPENGFYKHYTGFLKDGIMRCYKAHSDREMEFRIWADKLPARYKKENEKMSNILFSRLKKEVSPKFPLTSILEKDSRLLEEIQLADLLLGAVMAAWRKETKMSAKLDLQVWIADHLGWNNLSSDTKPWERKFNIWWFQPDRKRPRSVITRDVKLKYPYRNQ